jgi:hypothetical protein
MDLEYIKAVPFDMEYEKPLRAIQFSGIEKKNGKVIYRNFEIDVKAN